jgi:membrane protein
MRPGLIIVLKSVRVLLRLVLHRFGEDRCLQVAGNLTFTSLLALVPLFTIAFALFTAFPMFEDWSNAFKVFLLTALVPEVSGKIITVYMQQFADSAAKLTAIGLIFLAVTALALMLSIERVFNVIWRVPAPRPVLQRLMIYWAALTIGPLLIGASLSLTSWLVTQSMSVAADVKELHTVLLKTVPIILNVVAFALLYVIIPNRKVAIKDALIGGVAAAVAFELMKRAFGLYVQLFPTYALIYGAFATVPIFLLWIYLSWIVILFGAVVVAVMPRWRMGGMVQEEAPGERFFLALKVIEILFGEHGTAQTLSTAQIATDAGLSEEDAEQLLERMQHEGWVRRVSTAGWVLARDLATLSVLDVYCSFVLRGRPQGEPSDLARVVGELMQAGDERLSVSIRSLLDARRKETQTSVPGRADLPSRPDLAP